MATKQEMINAIQAVQQKRQVLRTTERQVVSETQKLTQSLPMVSGNDLRGNLAKILPVHLFPTNVGKLSQIMTPVWFSVEFPLGTDPTYGPNFRANTLFQVNRETAFLVTGITRTWRDSGNAGFRAPLELTFRDNQSTRAFNNVPMPIQTISYRGIVSPFETPFLLQPNCSLNVELSSFIPQSMPTIGDGYQEIVFHGYQVSPKDAKFLSETMFL